ncbi:MAG: RdgB/HAM1 family non-canonical purine NTP pyrophosphatase [Methylococcales bacterium]|nr:RdgB/HAM1 family non-canonical purine NTP pyrophosphatase [Methylococcales bacterium]
MTRHGGQWVLASGNRGKIRELQALLPDIDIRPQAEFAIPEAVEDAPSFVENALLKARQAARLSGLPALADDSGLVVDALHGAPGVRSARYAGDSADDAANNRQLLAALAEVPWERRSARFVCVLVWLRHADDPCPIIAEGVWEGRILTEPEGGNGFGYDPLFWVPGHDCASAQLSPEQKNHLSHRAQALQALKARLP